MIESENINVKKKTFADFLKNKKVIKSNDLPRNRFEMVGIKLASPRRIKEWSERTLPNGEVVGQLLNPDTINYRTGRPEPQGLLCEKIFGPLKSWECACGQCKFTPKNRPFFCNNCGVELTESHVRRHRMGHVVLNYPVTHTWYLKGSPSYLSIILDEPVKELETIIYLVREQKSLEQLEEEARQAIKQLLRPEKKTTKKYLSCLKQNDKKKYNKLLKFKDSLIQDLNWNEFLAGLDFTNDKLEKPLRKLFFEKTKISGIAQSREEYTKQEKIKRKHRQRLKSEKIVENWIEKDGMELLVENHGSTKILNLLESLNLPQEIAFERNQIASSTISKREKILKRLRLLETFLATHSEPAWMVLRVLPILPPSLRPVFELPNGTYMSSDFNEHYRRIIMRNNRLLRFCEQNIPDFVLINEKILIQDAIDDLIDNGSRFGMDSFGPRNKPLRCLNDLIAGKEGRFRQNLLGKRVDFSGRSVIVVGPSLMLDQCALPYEMALELFRPYLIYTIRENVARAKELEIRDFKVVLQKNYVLIWLFLSVIVSMSLVLLNRAPTLHRLGIQAFRPILTTGRAIQLHPLVCPGFNADFDGDQIGVHLPLTKKTQFEAYRILSVNNLLAPSNGKPMLTPGQDITLGWYYLTTKTFTHLKSANRYFSNFSDICTAFERNEIDLHASVWVEYSGTVSGSKSKYKYPIYTNVDKHGNKIEIFENIQIKKDKTNKILKCYISTTPGRVLLNELIATAIHARPLTTILTKEKNNSKKNRKIESS